MATGAEAETVECPECGGTMELQEINTKKSIPVVGSEVEVGKFICQDCAVGRRYERSGPTEEWS